MQCLNLGFTGGSRRRLCLKVGCSGLGFVRRAKVSESLRLASQQCWLHCTVILLPQTNNVLLMLACKMHHRQQELVEARGNTISAGSTEPEHG